jgi:multimeric flavodoxin WrbA
MSTGKVIAVCGSPRLNGNTEELLQFFCDRVKDQGLETELILLAKNRVEPCIACVKCKQTKDGACAQGNDDFNAIFDKMKTADAVVLGSPVYFGCATAQITGLLQRAGYVAKANGGLLSGKVGGAVVVARRAGQNFTFAQLNYFFTISEMVIPGSTYWNVAFGRNKGEVMNDEEGVQTVARFADNVAALVKKLRA